MIGEADTSRFALYFKLHSNTDNQTIHRAENELRHQSGGLSLRSPLHLDHALQRG